MEAKGFLSVFIMCSLLQTCDTHIPTEFSEGAKNESFLNLKGDTETLNEILTKYKGEKVVLDIWASWCRDCVKGIIDLKQVQKDYPNVQFVFLSLDRSVEAWKKGIQKYQLEGDHFYINSGWDGDFSKFLDLDWIPRYVVIDENSKISIFKAIRANDIHIKKTLQ